MRGERLDFVRITPRHTQELAAGRPRLEALLGVPLPYGWPQFPEAFALPQPGADPEPADDWGGYLFIERRVRVLVGNGGFHGAPAAGAVEIGYEVAPAYCNQGYASEAVRALVGFAFDDARVNRVIAHTLAVKNASNVVLERAGFEFAAELPNDELGKIWRYERLRR